MSVLGPQWAAQGLAQPGWVLLPLRAFLGSTFCYAGLQKLANPDFFNAGSPGSVQHQMSLLAPTSPIGPLVDLSLHGGPLIGILIAVGELAIGVGTLLGLRTRWAAAAGAVLALTFFLTVSWNTTPYYYGADIVFLFAWTPFITIGAGGVLSIDAWLATRTNTPAHAPAKAGRGLPSDRARPRRVVLITGLATATLAAFTAVIGRLVAGSPTGAVAAPVGAGNLGAAPNARATRATPASPRPANSPPSQAPSAAAPSGTRIASVSSLPAGRAAAFTDPASGGPAWVFCRATGDYAAHSAICTHAGCTVDFDPGSRELVCPCHGGAFNAATGEVLSGPPPAPLAAIPVHIAAGQIYVT